MKPITQNLLSSSLSLNIKFSEDTTEHKRFLKVELDVEALQTITTSFLEALLTVFPFFSGIYCIYFATGKFDIHCSVRNCICMPTVI